MRTAAVVLCMLAGGTILASLLIMHAGDAGIVSKNYPASFPGLFLFNAFSWAAYYIPCYLVCCGLFILRFSKRHIIALMLSLFPFLTMAALFQLLFTLPEAQPALVAGIRAIIGAVGGSIFLFIYSGIETAIIFFIFRQMGIPSVPEENEKFVQIIPDGNTKGTPVMELPIKNAAILPDPEEQYYKLKGLSNKGLYDRNTQGEQVVDLEDLETDTDADLPEEANVTESPVIKESVSQLHEARIPHRVPEGTVARMRKQSKKWSSYKIDPDSVLSEYKSDEYWKIDKATQRLAETLKTTLEEFKIKAEVTGIQKGPVITMFEILPAPGVKLSKIVNLADNIALRLAASRVRIVAPIPGKQAVGIEVPNAKRSIVSLREILSHPSFLESHAELPVALGKDITGVVQFADLTLMPHLLIAGATGSGKSVCVNSLICSILFRKSPSEARLILIDPKIVELKYYNDIPHLLTPVITDPKRAFQALQYCIAEMERRYSLLDALCVRDVRAYNRKIRKKSLTTEPIPYIVIIIDEFADLMATTGKELESTLARLAAMSRAVGIHLVLATQRPSIDVITGLIKANIPSRIAFMVAGKFDSRIILDSVGAEKLLGQGDMLFLPTWDPSPVRMQGTYISDDEVEKLVAQVKLYGEPEYIDDEMFIDEDDMSEFVLGDTDHMYDKALEI
ncbi:MAG: DNA translocase FtsK, partial [Spirochaetaceae bacterium]